MSTAQVIRSKTNWLVIRNDGRGCCFLNKKMANCVQLWCRTWWFRKSGAVSSLGLESCRFWTEVCWLILPNPGPWMLAPSAGLGTGLVPCPLYHQLKAGRQCPWMEDRSRGWSATQLRGPPHRLGCASLTQLHGAGGEEEQTWGWGGCPFWILACTKAPCELTAAF